MKPLKLDNCSKSSINKEIISYNSHPPHTRVLCQTCQTGFVWWWSPRPMSLRVAPFWSRHNGVWSSIVLQQCYICSGKKLFFLFLLYPEKSVTFHINHITEVTLVYPCYLWLVPWTVLWHQECSLVKEFSHLQIYSVIYIWKWFW